MVIAVFSTAQIATLDCAPVCVECERIFIVEHAYGTRDGAEIRQSHHSHADISITFVRICTMHIYLCCHFVFFESKPRIIITTHQQHIRRTFSLCVSLAPAMHSLRRYVSAQRAYSVHVQMCVRFDSIWC